MNFKHHSMESPESRTQRAVRSTRLVTDEEQDHLSGFRSGLVSEARASH